ncbi:hypothetical protein KHQ81_09390 [Mycoplasmatota bacterium]|nr:hypothetical protein KHQ81_09390 [Mycoplasmatota bacterium]
MNNYYINFMDNVLPEKSYLIILCLKDITHNKEDVDVLYERGIISLFYVYKLYETKVIYHENFDFLAYQFILQVMRYYIHKDKV